MTNSESAGSEMSSAKLVIATDGACSGNPGPAGWGWVIDERHWACGGFARSTNNVAELTAILEAVRSSAGHDGPVEILSDSQYAIDALTKWHFGWRKKGWKTAAGTPVANVELIKETLEVMAGRRVQLTKVKGHSGHHLNELADAKARLGAERAARGDSSQLRAGMNG